MCRGGMLMIRLRIWPREIASRCSIMASMCQPGMNGVAGSRTCHITLTKSFRLRVASSRSISLIRFGLESKSFKLLEFFTVQFRKIGLRGNLDRPAGRATVLVIDVIFVPEQILRKKNGGGNVAVARLPKEIPA